MQTFLPYSDFAKSARILDDLRLNKQKVEGWQILNYLLTPGVSKWENHPAVRMWKGYEDILCEYLDEICHECERRKIQDNANLHDKILNTLYKIQGKNLNEPFWLGNPEFHNSHKLNLIYKDAHFYGPNLITNDIKAQLKDIEKPAYTWPIFRNEYSVLDTNKALVDKRYKKPRKIISDVSHPLPMNWCTCFYSRDVSGKKVNWLLEDKI